MKIVKAGSVWMRRATNRTPQSQVGKLVTVQAVTPERVTYFYSGSTREYSSTLHWFVDAFLEVSTPEVQAGSWDYAEADRLHDAAIAATKAYNEYIARKPATVYTRMFESPSKYEGTLRAAYE